VSVNSSKYTTFAIIGITGGIMNYSVIEIPKSLNKERYPFTPIKVVRDMESLVNRKTRALDAFLRALAQKK